MEEQRSTPARIGIAALNLLTPGLGLLRLNRLRPALLCYLAFAAIAAVLVIASAVLPIFSFSLLVGSVAILMITSIGGLLASIFLSWRESRTRAVGAQPWWTRWYSIALLWSVALLIQNLIIQRLHGSYKPFYLPAESMAPTLFKNDRMVASMRPPATLARGDVILLAVGDTLYVKRVAGLPGDTIALRGGEVILNGRPVVQSFERVEAADGPFGRQQTRRLREQFPGEVRSHEIYDSGPSEFDDFPEIRVRPGHVFVLGDNRDLSADSRVARPDMAWNRFR